MDGFDWKHPTDAMKGYKSPVDIYYRDILEQVKEATDNYIMAEIKMYVDVDKDELIKAMKYDRNQYATGYRNGYADAQKHGKWKPRDLTYGRSMFYCTNCEEATEVPTGNGVPLYRYCPNCGARMYDPQESEVQDAGND